jgi:hypothetical protein
MGKYQKQKHIERSVVNVAKAHQKGHALESKVETLLLKAIVSAEAEDRAEVISHPSLTGKSAQWHPDLVMKVHSLFDPLEERSLELAIVECKFIDETGSEGTYWSQMSRAYMSLNDLRLANREGLSFILVVNRLSKGFRRDYSEVFRNIGVKLVNINDSQDCLDLENELKNLLAKSTFDEQIRKLKELISALKR